MDLSNSSKTNGNGNGNGTHSLPADPLISLTAPLSEIQAFVTALGHEWMPYTARVFFDRLQAVVEIETAPEAPESGLQV